MDRARVRSGQMTIRVAGSDGDVSRRSGHDRSSQSRDTECRGRGTGSDLVRRQGRRAGPGQVRGRDGEGIRRAVGQVVNDAARHAGRGADQPAGIRCHGVAGDLRAVGGRGGPRNRGLAVAGGRGHVGRGAGCGCRRDMVGRQGCGSRPNFVGGGDGERVVTAREARDGAVRTVARLARAAAARGGDGVAGHGGSAVVGRSRPVDRNRARVADGVDPGWGSRRDGQRQLDIDAGRGRGHGEGCSTGHALGEAAGQGGAIEAAGVDAVGVTEPEGVRARHESPRVEAVFSSRGEVVAGSGLADIDRDSRQGRAAGAGHGTREGDRERQYLVDPGERAVADRDRRSGRDVQLQA